MKTKTRPKTKLKRVIKANKTCTALIILNTEPNYAKLDLCLSCGKADPKGGVWQDPVTQDRYVWCRNEKCKKKVQAKAPRRVWNHHRMYARPGIVLRNQMADLFNDIELSNDVETGADIVRGYSAKICHEAWAYSIYRKDNVKALKLFKLRPMSKFLVFNEDGKMTSQYNTYREADRKRKKREVIVFWRGK